MLTHRQYVYRLVAIFLFAFVAMLAFVYASDTPTRDKWTACANQCAPMAPAEYERACYCDTRTTLPPEPE